MLTDAYLFLLVNDCYCTTPICIAKLQLAYGLVLELSKIKLIPFVAICYTESYYFKFIIITLALYTYVYSKIDKMNLNERALVPLYI